VDDIVGAAAGGWTLDPAARHAMLLDAARTALAHGDHAAAVVLAEELLDELPDDADALLVVAEAAPEYGHGEVGALAAVQAARRGAEVGALEARALLAACEVERALVSVDAAIARRPDDARAHLVRGLALELCRRDGEAAAAFARAASLDAAVCPPLLDIPADEWEPLLLAAGAGLDAPLRDALRGVSLDLLDLPPLELLRGLHPPPSPLVVALLLEEDGRPPRVEIYRRNLLRGAATLDELEERLRAALHAEAELLLQEDD
jgi:hypothetical protein